MKIAISEKCLNIFVPNFAHLFCRNNVHQCVALCCIYLTYVKLTETQTSRTNFTTEQKVDFIITELSNKYHLCCDVIIFMFTCNIAL